MFSFLALGLIVAGYVLLAFFIIIERALRRTERARSLRSGSFDRRSARVVGAAFGIGLTLPILLDSLFIDTFSINLVQGVIGMAGMVFGISKGVVS